MGHGPGDRGHGKTASDDPRAALDQQASATDSGTVIEQNDNPHARDERYVWFGLEGDFDPDDISRATGLTPSQTFMKGTKPRPGASARGASGWIIDSGLAPSDEVHEHLDDLLARLRPAWDALRALGRKHDAFITAAIYCRSSQGPLVQVAPAQGAAIAELGATLGFDIYALPEEEATGSSCDRLLTRDELSRLSALIESDA